jgi:DNA-binding transcriptional LysR family regulator
VALGFPMLDRVTLDQLRTLLAIVEAGSFSAAGRRLKRAQSAISHAMTRLEEETGVVIWNRSTKVPRLTDAGRALVTAARRVCDEVDALGRVAGGLADGLEPSLSLCVEAIFPLRALIDLCRDFSERFPSVELRVRTETLSAVSDRVLTGSAELGVVGPAAPSAGLERVHLATVRMVPVVARTHALAAYAGRIPQQALARQTQIVLSERGEAGASGVPDQGVLSDLTWRVVDLETKHELIRAGLGWGNLPEHRVRADLESGALVQIAPAPWGEREFVLPLSIIYVKNRAQGPAARWLIQHMAELCSREVDAPSQVPSTPGMRSRAESSPSTKKRASRRSAGREEPPTNTSKSPGSTTRRS